MKISLFGYGNTNKAIASQLKNCDIYDDSFTQETIDENSNRLLPSKAFNPEQSSVEIVTPGIPPHNILCKNAKNLMSDYDYFHDNMPFSIWISGTNGKTTTTQMLQHLLGSYGSYAGGNIGNAVALLPKDAKIWILETSSFTLHYTNIAKPNIYILLPIEQDHISWHGSFEAYEEAKLKPLKSLQEGEVAIVPQKYKDYPTNGFLIPYNSSTDLASYFDIDISQIKFKEPFLLDALLALATTKILYDKIDYNLINSFTTDAHKIEEFHDTKSRLWVDDSKATNVTATLEAIKRYKDSQIFLILGGDDKGADLSQLYNEIKNFNIKIFTIGANASKLHDNFTKTKQNSIICNTLENAVKQIDKEYKNGVAILSPAAASFDQFDSYKHRGESFKLYVNSL